MGTARQRWTLLGLALVALAPAGCKREARRFEQPPAAAERPAPVRLSPLQPGPTLPADRRPNPLRKEAWSISEGKRLFDAYNCTGCHAHGGGGMGPALMDDTWIYGDAPANLYESIVEGRPNGMPSFGGHLPSSQVWQLVAYVRSLSNDQPKSATPVRDDHLQGRRSGGQEEPQAAEPPENRPAEPGGGR